MKARGLRAQQQAVTTPVALVIGLARVLHEQDLLLQEMGSEYERAAVDLAEAYEEAEETTQERIRAVNKLKAIAAGLGSCTREKKMKVLLNDVILTLHGQP